MIQEKVAAVVARQRMHTVVVTSSLTVFSGVLPLQSWLHEVLYHVLE